MRIYLWDTVFSNISSKVYTDKDAKETYEFIYFPFDMKENAIDVFKRFQEYADEHLKEKTSTI
jgi:hypothetical protein